MQTIKFTMNMRHDADSNTSIATEHIVADDKEAKEAGREARRLINEFVAGFTEAGEET